MLPAMRRLGGDENSNVGSTAGMDKTGGGTASDLASAYGNRQPDFFGQFHDAVGDSGTCLQRFLVVFAVQDADQLAFASLTSAMRASNVFEKLVFEKPPVDFAIAIDNPVAGGEVPGNRPGTRLSSIPLYPLLPGDPRRICERSAKTVQPTGLASTISNLSPGTASLNAFIVA